MNIEEKAKRYDEAIDKITDVVEAGTIEQGLAEWLFPELKESESEDERIRKELLVHIQQERASATLKANYAKWDRWIAWLEKKKEEPSIADIVDEHFWEMLGDKKQGEQKPAVIIPRFRVGDKIRRKTPSSFDKDMEVARIDKDYYVCNHIGKFSSEVVKFSEEDSYELVEHNPAWSEEDEVKINRIVACLENLNVADNDILLKDVDWLKSIKDRYTWKPSDEQIKSIKEAACYSSVFSEKTIDNLISLSKQLKKLREE